MTSSELNFKARAALAETLERIDGAYAPASIRAYKADFNELIHFCDEEEEEALPTHPQTIANFIVKMSNGKRSSASIRRAVAGIATIHKLNRHQDPTKDPDVVLEMRRMHRKLGRSSNQAGSINADT